MKKLAVTCGSISLILVSLEIILRLLGFQGQDQQPQIVETVFPNNPMCPDITLGYVHCPGSYTWHYSSGLTWSARYESDGTRATRPERSNSAYAEKPQVVFLGDGFTEGEGIPDSLSYPYMFQRHFPLADVKNYALGGHGTVQAFLRLKNLVDSKKVHLVIFAYSGSYRARNEFSPMYRKAMNEWSSIVGGYRFPYAKVENGKLQIVYDFLPSNAVYSVVPLSHYSALANGLENLWLFADYLWSSEGRKTSENLVVEMNRICEQRDVRLLVVGIDPINETSEFLSFCTENGILNTDVSVDYLDNDYNLEPYDYHPNAAAHEAYYMKLAAYCESQDLIPKD